MTAFRMLDFIAARRDRREHGAQAIHAFVGQLVSGAIPDYQTAAWLMAAVLNPLNENDTAILTQAMASSGVTLDLSELPKPWLDKHSTGGVGDKTTIALVPALAACGATMVKMSGRGLGITGGTIDKLASIPGMRLDFDPDELVELAADTHLAVAGANRSIAAADKTLYELRDATGTVSCIPLIVSSILSKKIAGGAKHVMLDVKVGSGAFMTNLVEARELAGWLVRTGRKAGLNIRAAVTDMSCPLGRTVGNALEVYEAFDFLAGKPSGRFGELCIELGGQALDLAGLAHSPRHGRERLREAVTSGQALRKAGEWLDTQGGSFEAVLNRKLPAAPVQLQWRHKGGRKFVESIEAGEVGALVVELGGGRRKKEDEIDPSVGVEFMVEQGSPIGDGDMVARIHARNDEEAAEALERLKSSVSLADKPVRIAPLVFDVL
ncbi:MAG: pyrimidine-nucleoside phosphorylase [Chthonomonas sp.]